MRKQLILIMNLLFIFVIYLTAISCKNPIQKNYNKDTYTQDIQEIKKNNLNNKEDINILEEWITISTDEKGLDNKTYKEILKDAKLYKKEQEELKEKVRKIEEEKKIKKIQAVTITIYDYNYLDRGLFNSYKQFKYAIENKSDKEIKSITFTFKIYNSSGTEIGEGYKIALTDSNLANKIAPHSIYQGEMNFDSTIIDNDLELQKSKFSDLKFNLTIDKIEYSDGTVLE